MDSEVWLTRQEIFKLLEQQGISRDNGDGIAIEMGIQSIIEALSLLSRDVILELEWSHGINPNYELTYSPDTSSAPVISLKMLRLLLLKPELIKMLRAYRNLESDTIWLIYDFVNTALTPEQNS
jgi:hypothetical protein